jgi:hypothetical protein
MGSSFSDQLKSGKLVARAVSTCSVLRGEKAEGR